MRTSRPLPPVLALAVLLPACGSSDDGSAGPEPLTLSAIKVGASWTYRNTDLNELGGPKETTVTKEITGCEMLGFVDCDTMEMREYNAYVQETIGGAADPDDANTLYMVQLDDGLVRVKQDVIEVGTLDHYVTYSPYFMRLFTGPYDPGRSEDFTHMRCEYLAADNSLRGTTTRRYRHEVIANDEGVNVEQGDYDGALHVKRTDLSDNDVKDYWYVAGVGKLYEEAHDTTGALVGKEELTAFTEGTGTCE